jgi:hypothetical protein
MSAAFAAVSEQLPLAMVTLTVVPDTQQPVEPNVLKVRAPRRCRPKPTLFPSSRTLRCPEPSPSELSGSYFSLTVNGALTDDAL